MVEGAALEMLFRGNSNEGSNPSLSVFIQYFIEPLQARKAKLGFCLASRGKRSPK